MAQSDQDEKFAGTYRKLFDTIERGVEQCSADRLQTLLEEKKDHLKLGLEAFAEPSAQSRSKFTGSTVSVEGKSIKLEQNEKDLVFKLSDILNLSELQCASLWEAYRLANKDTVARLKNTETPVLCERQELIMNVVSFHYEDRISLLECIGSLQRIMINGNHPFTKLVQDTMEKLLDSDSTTPFNQRLFKQYAKLVRSNVPNKTYSFPGWALLWAKQNLKEQKALLEIIFLFSLTSTFTPAFIFSIIQEYEANCFSLVQAFGYVLDEEGVELRDRVTYISSLLAVNIVLPATVTTDIKLTPGGKTLLDAPEIILQINQVVSYLGERTEHAPFLLAWSYFIHCLGSALYGDEHTTMPSNYKIIEDLLAGKQQVSPSVLITRPSVNDSFNIEDRQVSIHQAPHFERTLGGRSLKLEVFRYISSILKSEICHEEDVNSHGYRSVLRKLFKAFLSTTPPCFIPADSYDALVKAYCQTYQGQAELCDTFWTEDFNSEDRNSLLSTARDRFPVVFTDFVQLLSALSGAHEDEEDNESSGGKSAQQVYDYLRLMPTITTQLASETSVSASSQNDPTALVANQAIRVTPQFTNISCVEITEGSNGVLLSGSATEPVVKFVRPYSGWHLLTTVLAGFVNHAGFAADVLDDENNLKGKNIEAINSILELFHTVLSNNSKLIVALVEHIEGVSHVPGLVSTTPVIISVLCNILSACSSLKPCPISTMTLTLNCLTLLIPFYRNDIWVYLQSAPLLPRPNAAIPISTRFTTSLIASNPAAQVQQIVSNVECTIGRYTLLLAFIDMVSALVHDVQRNWWNSNESNLSTAPATNRQYQVEVLYLCLHYLMLNVLPTYSNWRYKKISERCLIGSKVLSILIEVTRGFKEPASAVQPGLSLSTIRDGVFNNFLYEGGAYHIAPLLDVISEGANNANVYYKINHPKEAQRFEKLTELNFVFVKILLYRRLEHINGGSTIAESKLEHLLLERTGGHNNSDFLLLIARHINYRHSITLKVQATNVLNLLCRTTSTWQKIPNFVSHLGSTDQVQQIIRAYLAIAKDHLQNETLLSSVWQLMTALLESQPSLAILFLDCGDSILPSPKSAVRLLPGQHQSSTPAPAVTPTTTESAIRCAIDVLYNWETLSIEKPTVSSNVLRFIAIFWETAYDHYAIVERTRSDNALWDALGRVLLNPASDIDISNQHLQAIDFTTDVSASRKDRFVRRLCCLNLSKTYVLRIMALEIHFTANNNTTIMDRLPAGLKNLMSKINDSAKLTQLRQAIIKNDYNAAAAAKVLDDAETILESIGVYGLPDALLFKMESIRSCGDSDVAGEARQYGDSYLYDFHMASTRTLSLFKDAANKHGFNNSLDDMIVTPEVQFVLDLQEHCNSFLKSVLEFNYNSSIVDTQIALLGSFKTLISTASHRASELIWANKTNISGAASLFAFLQGLIKTAQEEIRDDGVSLTSYGELIQFIRELTEDWINKNKSVLLGTDIAAKKDYVTKTFNLLSDLSALLNRENFAVMKSITDKTAVRFHRPLLESVLLSLRTMAGDICHLTTSQTEFQVCLLALLSVVCKSFHVLVIKAGSYGARGSNVAEECQERCMEDVTEVSSLLQELISAKYAMPENIWLDCFTENDTIASLLSLFYGGVQIVVNEVDSANGSSGLIISTYADTALYLLLEISNIPKGAEALYERDIFSSLCNNNLATRLQQGDLDLFIRFGDSNNNNVGPAFVERNPLHVIWCQILAIVSNINRHCGKRLRVFERTVNFLQTYSPQIGKAFTNANGAQDVIFGLNPSESLSAPLLEEMERIQMVFFSLAKHFKHHSAASNALENLFVSYKDCSLFLLQRYLYYFTHPTHMQSQLFAIDNVERHRLNDAVPVEKNSQEESSNNSSTKSSTEKVETRSRLLLKTLKSMLIVSHYMITTLVILTESPSVLTQQDIHWPFGNTVIEPDLRSTSGGTTSFGTLIECINWGITMIGHWSTSKEYPVLELLNFVQDSALLLTTQLALSIARPNITDEYRREIGQENVTDIVDTIGKVESSFKKVTGAEYQVGSRVKLIQTLLSFLGQRYYGK